MLKDYVQHMQSENEKRLADLEEEMQELETDLSSAERMMEKMKQEKSVDTIIFSPRALNQKLDDEIIEKQEKIAQLKQRMEYVAQMIEEGINTREEYRRLEEELNGEIDEKTSAASENLNGDPEITEELPAENVSETIFPEDLSEQFDAESAKEPAEGMAENPAKEPAEGMAENPAKVIAEGIAENPAEEIVEEVTEEPAEQIICSFSQEKRAELLSFLNDIYKRTETSLAFLNGNKNRSRAELKNSMRLIKDFAKKVENEEF
ncbi:MAG: hypothetical protein LIO76_07835 [Clostridiales bacterium]|nr:hypothetical protein [Clostridiales bacterium]